jgi:hypothetical protein
MTESPEKEINTLIDELKNDEEKLPNEVVDKIIEKSPDELAEETAIKDFFGENIKYTASDTLREKY